MNKKRLELAPGEREYLRNLAKRQAEYAALPIMAEREKMWFNSAKQERLLREIGNHELIDDDKVISETFDITWDVEIDEFGVTIPRESVKDSEGYDTAYHFVHPILDLRRDIGVLKPARCSVDREETFRHREFLEELFGDILPVVIRSSRGVYTVLTHRIIPLMGMQAFFPAMYEYPDELHRLMSYLRDNALSIMRWYESEGLLVLNNANQESFGSSFNFTDALPSPGFNGEHVRLCDMWLSSNSRWCNQQFMADELRGTGIVYSRKPDPKYLSIDKHLDEEAWAAHLRETLDTTDGVPTVPP